MQSYIIRYYDVHPILKTIDPNAWWMKSKLYVPSTRAMGVAGVIAGGRLLYLVVRLLLRGAWR